ncbi:MAG: glutathione peroxidase [Novosphingobium pentaromativorans]|uniref:Glutathione peroxidase n=1 Tax=Novosphingobium pentaromativorans TaxID=205844 RepID=A0A2W5NTT4_9SPHN|nr:glutathione peroxidase [Novosphingobium panipatense]PZQ54065.1 MAG: glutathione peroxidase [Novosphingobium pentaromativorans]
MASPADPRTIADFEATMPGGEAISLADRLGKVLLVVNTASKCGFTPQYAGLEALWQKYRARGFEVIAFPCNQFGAQEPGSADEIASFCEVNFGLSFPLMGKVDVNGEQAPPLWSWLKSEAPGVLGSKSVKWNFTKFLIGRDGKVVRRYAPTDKPGNLEKDIEALL